MTDPALAASESLTDLLALLNAAPDGLRLPTASILPGGVLSDDDLREAKPWYDDVRRAVGKASARLEVPELQKVDDGVSPGYTHACSLQSGLDAFSRAWAAACRPMEPDDSLAFPMSNVQEVETSRRHLPYETNHLVTRTRGAVTGLERIRESIKRQSEQPSPGPKAGSEAAKTPYELPLGESTEGDLVLVDEAGEFAKFRRGTAAWALLWVLRKEAADTSVDVKVVAQRVDLVLAEADAEVSAEVPPPENLDGDTRFNATQIVKKTRSRSTYSGLEPEIIINRFSSLLRKVRGERAKRWRDRWVHWDRKTETVAFESRD